MIDKNGMIFLAQTAKWLLMKKEKNKKKAYEQEKSFLTTEIF